MNGWWMSLILLCSLLPTTTYTPSLALPFPPLAATRVGEARRPGPSHVDPCRTASDDAADRGDYDDLDDPDATSSFSQAIEAERSFLEDASRIESGWPIADIADSEAGRVRVAAAGAADDGVAHYADVEDYAATMHYTTGDADGDAAADAAMLDTHPSNECWDPDRYFTPEQLDRWREYETRFGLLTKFCSRSAPQHTLPRDPLASLDFSTDFVGTPGFVGQVKGFAFGTGSRGTGYYADLPQSTEHHGPATLQLDSLIPPDRPPQPASTASTLRPQSDREPLQHEEDCYNDSYHGFGVACIYANYQTSQQRRRRQRGKRRRLAAIQAGLTVVPTDGVARSSIVTGLDTSISYRSAAYERWWAARGMWAIDSYNGNSWHSVSERYLGQSNADVALLQETKLPPDSVGGAMSLARQKGWNAVHAPAWKTAHDGTSGGVSVLSRRGFGIQDASHIVPQALRHRITISLINAVIPGGIFVISVYLRDSEGLSAENLCILESLATMIGTLDAPYVISGDWNLPPDVMASSNWPKMVDGHIFATQVPTCNEMIYDFFIVSAAIAPAVAAVQRIDSVGAAPHYPVRLLIRGDAHRLMVRRLVKPPRVPAVLPHGPPSQTPEYGLLATPPPDASTEQIASNIHNWYNQARSEWNSLSGDTAQHKPAYFRWEPVVRKQANGPPGTDRISISWCKLAMHAREIARVLTRTNGPPDSSGYALLHDSLVAASRLHWKLPKSARAEAGTSISRQAQSLFHATTHGSPAWATSIANCAMKNAQKVEQANCRQRTRAWREKLGIGSGDTSGFGSRPGSNAYRWLKGPAGWALSTMGSDSWHDGIPSENRTADSNDEDTNVVEDDDALLIRYNEHAAKRQTPLADQAAVDAERSKWASLWKEDDSYNVSIIEDSECDALALLCPWAIKQAAVTFPPGTGLGADNVSPRALLRLSEAALTALGFIYQAIERVGSWTEAIQLVLIVLLPKNDGGLRPIGLFPTLIRVWMRARLYLTRAWETMHQIPEIYGGPSMGAFRASWNEGFMAEFAAGVRADFLQALVDLVKCFETVPHDELLAAAKARNLPLTVLRLSLAAYRLARSLGVDGVYSATVVATRGITAGSGFATTELRVILFDLIIEVRRRWTFAFRLTVYVDDLTLSSNGTPRQVLHTMLRALSFIVNALQERLRMQVAPKKSFSLAGRPSLSKALSGAMAKKTVAHRNATRLLGADNAAGRRRSTKTTRARIAGVKKTTKRYHVLRKMGVNTRLAAQTAATPKMTYAAEAMGVSNTGLHAMRTTAAHLVAGPISGKNPDLVLLAHDLDHGSMDPAFNAHIGPVRCWALAWWQQWQPASHLQAAFTLCKNRLNRLNPKCSPWQVSTGPTMGLILSLRRLGWSTDQADRSIDDLGQTWCFTLDAPAAILNAVKASVKRWRANRVATLIPSIDPTTSDVASVTQQHFLMPIVAPLESVLHRCKPPRYIGWKAEWAPYLKSALSGGQWTQERRSHIKAARGLDDRCQLCLSAKGTAQHRLVCPSIIPADGWQPLPQRAWLANDKMNAARLLLLSTRALLCARLPHPAVHEGWFRWILEPDDRVELHSCKWYTDGSLINPGDFPFQSCGFAVVVISQQGTLLGIGLGAPPSWIKTAAGSEAWALRFVLSVNISAPPTFTDCQALLRMVDAGPIEAMAACRPLARIWVDIHHFTDGDFATLKSQLKWIPAHRSLASIGNTPISDGSMLTAVDWRANRLVDIIAKSAAAESQAPTEVLRFLESARVLLLAKATTLAQATFLANNAQVVTTDEHGTSKTVTKRDTTDKPAVIHPLDKQSEAKRAERVPANTAAVACVQDDNAVNSCSPVTNPATADSYNAIPKDAHVAGCTCVMKDPAVSMVEVETDNQRTGGSLSNLRAQEQDAHVSYNVGYNDDGFGPTRFSDICHEKLVDSGKEIAAMKVLPSPQSLLLSDTPASSSKRSLPSRDKQDITRRAATRSKANNARNTERMVQELGQRAERAEASTSTDKASAASRLAALRDRIRARQNAPA